MNGIDDRGRRKDSYVVVFLGRADGRRVARLVLQKRG